ncbi:MAG: DUF4010 domain-containing protein [Dehalococcoidia bacterium]|nr:DUF4010 domain-containing protein [Dehalococcoidia bacterium]
MPGLTSAALIAETSTDPFSSWSYLPTLERLALAIGLGLLIGLERERRGKDAGVRTFALIALLGCVGGLQGTSFAIFALACTAIVVIFINANNLRLNEEPELTTSAALLLVAFVGVLCGEGHTFTPVVVGIATATLLAWKERLVALSVGITEAELRSAILLGILAFVIYPILPKGAIGPGDAIEPRAAWITVILIAGIGFANYALLKILGVRGVQVAGFFGGLVNSTVTIAELSARVKETDGEVSDDAYRGIMLSVVAAVLRNAVLLWLVAANTLPPIIVPLSLMATVGTVLAVGRLHRPAPGPGPVLTMTSPFSLKSVLRFGTIFVGLQVVGAAATNVIGPLGLYAVSVVGGVASSASAVASAGLLAAHGQTSPGAAGVAAVIATISSIAFDLPIVASARPARRFTRRVAWSLSLVAGVGIASVATELIFFWPLISRLQS